MLYYVFLSVPYRRHRRILPGKYVRALLYFLDIIYL